MPRLTQLAKLSLPRLHQAVHRHRLFARLDARERQPVIWIGGPAGSGKTTLVASYLEARKPRALWYQVDEGDRDPATLFHYLALLIRQSGDQRAMPTLPADGDLEVFARHYFREFYGRLKRNAVLVLDNCQNAACETFHRLLLAASDELPQHVSLITLSRGLPPQEFARLTAHRIMQVIEWQDLRLSAHEALAIARSLGVTDARLVDESLRLSDGWATGLVLALSHVEKHVDATSARLSTREALFDYFMAEMFMRTSALGRRVLMHAALLPQVTVDQARHISGSDEAGTMLEQLHRGQFLVDRIVDQQVTYRYHDLFRAFLLEELERSLAPPELTAVRLRAAHLLEGDGQISEAIQLYFQAQHWDDLTRCVKTHAAQLLDQGRWQTVRTWINSIPSDRVGNDPWLQQWLGRALFVPDPRAARHTMEGAYRRFVEADDYTGVMLAVRVLVDVTFLTGEPLTHFSEWKCALSKAIQRTTGFTSKQIAIDAWSTYLDLVLHTGDDADLAAARAYLEERFLDDELTHADRLNVLASYCTLAWFGADMEACERALPLLLEEIVHEDATPMFRVWGQQWAGLITWSFGRFATAAAIIEEGLRWVEKFRLGAQEGFPYHYLNMCYHHLGKPQKATEVLARAQARAFNRHNLHGVLMAHAYAWHRYLQGEVAPAVQEISDATKVAESLDCLFAAHFGHCMLSALHCHLENWEEASAGVARSESVARRRPVEITAGLRQFVRAFIDLAQGQRANGLAHLSAGLEEARNDMKAAMLFCLLHRLPYLLSIALHEGMAPDVVCRLIRRWNLKPDPDVMDRWPWPVKIHALGELRILLDDEPLPSKGKAHFRVLALLKALIAAGGNAVNAHTLAEWLWPDAEGDAAASNLKVSVHRLRKLLQREDALSYHDGKVSLNPAVCWLDTWSFQRLSLQRGIGSSTQTPAANTEAVLALYRGPLLDGDESPWLLKQRESLAGVFRAESLAAGQRLEGDGQIERAIRIYERCLSIEPQSAAVYRQLMLCLQQAGLEAQALDAQRRYKGMVLVPQRMNSRTK